MPRAAASRAGRGSDPARGCTNKPVNNTARARTAPHTGTCMGDVCGLWACGHSCHAERMWRMLKMPYGRYIPQ